jgi:hypothetical protein
VPSPRDLHRAGTTVTSVLMVVIGVAMLVTTISRGGGALAIGIVLGVLFVVAGVGRLWLSRRST